MDKKKLLRLIVGVIIMFTPVLLLAQEQASIDRQSQNVQQPKKPDHELQFPDAKSKLQYQQEKEKEAIEFKRFGTKMEMFWIIGGTFMLILGLFAVIIMFFVIHARKERRRHELIGQFIEKGQEVPRELLLGKVPEAAISADQWPTFIRLRDFRRGTLLLCLGLGIGLTLYFLFDLDVAVLCLIFLFLSAACFINALFFSGKSDINR